LVRLMDRVIPAELRSNVFVFFDDLLILDPVASYRSLT